MIETVDKRWPFDFPGKFITNKTINTFKLKEYKYNIII